MKMTLQEWVNTKTSEMKGQKYREVILKQAVEVKMNRFTIQYELFTAKAVPMETTVTADRSSLSDSLSSRDLVPGVMVTFEVLKPRKRKMEREHFYLQIA